MKRLELGVQKCKPNPLRSNASHVQGHTDRRDGNPLTSSLYCVLEHEVSGCWYFVLSKAPAADKLTVGFLHFTAS
jgi:hypothetical protein